MYQKIAAALAAAVLCMPAYAAQTKNTMKMVSYFPVPYVAYDTVSANNAMDIGVLNQCVMDIKKGSSNLGGSACSLYLYGNANGADLNRGLLNVTAGKLDLNSTVNNARIVSKKVQIGENMTTTGGWLDIGIPSGKGDSYDALYLGSIANTGNSFRVTSKNQGAKVNSFHMFNEISNDFPGCAGTVTWQELELGADVDTNTTYTDVYLVCNGTGEVTPPQECQAPRGQTYTESCPNGQTGTITYTWQGEPTCSYKKTDNCQEEVCQPTKGQRYTEECPDGQTGTITYTWNQSSCSYTKMDNCQEKVCQPTNGQSYTIGCGANKTGSIIYTWNQSTCSYDKQDTCECDADHPYDIKGVGCVACNTPGTTWKCFDTYCSRSYRIRYCHDSYYDYDRDVCYRPAGDKTYCYPNYPSSDHNRASDGTCMPDNPPYGKWNGRDYCLTDRCNC